MFHATSLIISDKWGGSMHGQTQSIFNKNGLIGYNMVSNITSLTPFK